MGSFGLIEWLIIFFIIILFFGAKRIPDMARGLAQGYAEFRKASMDDKSDEDPESLSGEEKRGDGNERSGSGAGESGSRTADRN